jgi:hypothetical protein
MVEPSFLTVTPVFLGNLETLVFDLRTPLEALELLLIADLQPELDDNAPSMIDIVLEIVDLGVSA